MKTKTEPAVRCLIIKSDGTLEERTIVQSLETMQKIVGGSIEDVGIPGGSVIVHGEGLNRNLPINPLATCFVSNGWLIVGDVFIVGKSNRWGWYTSCPPEIIARVKELKNNPLTPHSLLFIIAGIKKMQEEERFFIRS